MASAVAVANPVAATAPIFPGFDSAYGYQGSVQLDPSRPTVVTQRVVYDADLNTQVVVGSVDGHMAVSDLADTSGYSPGVRTLPAFVPGVASDLSVSPQRGTLLAGVSSAVSGSHPVVQRLDDVTDPWGNGTVLTLPIVAASPIVDLDDDGTSLTGLTNVAGDDTIFVAHMDATGTPDSAWGVNGIAEVDLGPGDDTYIGHEGSFIVGTAGGSVRIAKLTASGSLDTSYADNGIFAPTLPSDAFVRTVHLVEGELVLGGGDGQGYGLLVHVSITNAPIALAASTALAGTIVGVADQSVNGSLAVLAADATTVRSALIATDGTLGLGAQVREMPIAGVIDAKSVYLTAVSAFVSTATTLVTVDFLTPSITARVAGWDQPENARSEAVAARADGSAIVLGTGFFGTWLDSVSPSGTRDLAFGNSILRPPVLGFPVGVHVLPGGSFVVAMAGLTSHLYRFTAAGALDPAYGTNGEVDIPGDISNRTVLFRPDGSVIAITNTNARAYRVDANGTVDPTFGIVSPAFGGSLTPSGEHIFFARVLPSGRVQVYTVTQLGGHVASHVLAANGDADPTSFRSVVGGYGLASTPLGVELVDGSVALVMSPAVSGSLTAVIDTGSGNPTPKAIRDSLCADSMAAAATADGGFLLLGCRYSYDTIMKVRRDLSLDSGFGIGGRMMFGCAVAIAPLGNDRFLTAGQFGPPTDVQPCLNRILGNEPSIAPSGRYVALATPLRLVDTRGGAPLTEGGHREFSAAGVGAIPANATALATNFALVRAEAGGGFGRIYGPGTTAYKPLFGGTSNLNLAVEGGTVSGFAAVRIGSDGTIGVYSDRTAHVVVDVYGYWVPATTATAGRYVSEESRRLLDTRTTAGGKRAMNPNEVRTIATGHAGATAAIINLTAVNPTADGFLKAYGSTLPATAALNFLAGRTRPNLVIVPLRADGTLRIQPSVKTNVVIDIVGYMTGATAPSSARGLFVPTSPTRLVDTRLGLQGNQPLTPGTTTPYVIGGDGGIPTNASGAILSVISVGAPQTGWLDVEISTGAPHTGTSVVNVTAPGVTASNSTIAQLNVGGCAVYSTAGGHLVMDASGYFTA